MIEETSDMLRERIPLAVWLAMILMGASSDRAMAQDSRTAIIEAQQAQKAGKAVPYTPNKAERIISTAQRELLQDPNGFYPFFGSVYSGGGFTLGAGYRQFYGDRTHADLKGLYSLKNYKLLEFSTDSWGHADGRFDLHARAGWRDATQIAFHGIGMNTPEERSNFRMQQAYAGGDVAAHPVPWTVFRGGLSFEDFSLESGTGNTPSIEEEHTPASAPGLGANPTYLHLIGSAGIDSRPSPGYARRGTLLQVAYHNYADSDDTYSFDRMDAEVVQHIPILRENWVISLHGLLQTTLDDDDTVPHFLMPSLGSGSTLRGFSSWRFRDRHSLLMSGEFRWIPSRLAIDMAVFYDTGKVTPRFDDISWKGLASDVGIGIRFHGPLATPLRVELARSREGTRLVFAGDAAF
jgi:hypothetical protein